MTQPPDDLAPVGDDDGLGRDLEPRRVWRIAPVTAVLGAVVLLAAGVTGGVVAHASLSDDSTNTAGGPGQGQRGYPGFNRQPGQDGAQGNGPGTVGTVESVSGSTLKVKTQDGTEVTVTLTPDTDIQVTRKGTATDIAKGSTVVVTGTGSGSTVTARTVREGDFFGGRRPTPSPTG